MSTASDRHPKVLSITSRDNPLIQRLRRLGQDPVAYRKLGAVWLEGDHLCAAAVQRRVQPTDAVIADTAWTGEHGVAPPADGMARELSALARQAERVVVVPEALWKHFTGLESPARLGFVLAQPGDGVSAAIRPVARTVVLDRVQDAGNVGSILRSAAAMGVEQVVAIKGTAGLWSPKVLRAGMGAHFALHLVEQATTELLAECLRVTLVGTSSHTDTSLPEADLPDPCAWVLGHEGQGVSAALQAQCRLTVRIPQPGGEESLNVAAAAAVCLYESMRQRLASSA